MDSCCRVAAGIRLIQFYAAGPVCTPPRASIVSGKYSLRYNIEAIFRDRGEYLSAGDTLPQLMKDGGYATALVGKWHLGGLRSKSELPFKPEDERMKMGKYILKVIQMCVYSPSP